MNGGSEVINLGPSTAKERGAYPGAGVSVLSTGGGCLPTIRMDWPPMCLSLNVMHAMSASRDTVNA